MCLDLGVSGRCCADPSPKGSRSDEMQGSIECNVSLAVRLMDVFEDASVAAVLCVGVKADPCAVVGGGEMVAMR